MQPRILYPARLSLKIEGDKKLPGQTKIKRICKHQTSPYRKYRKGSSKQRESLKVVDQKGTETIYSNSHLTGNTMALNSCLSIVTLNVNGLNAPIKRHRVSEWKKNKTHQYAAYKKLMLDPQTPPDWKWSPKQRESLKVTDQKGTETIYSNSHLTVNTMALNSYLSIATLNVNAPIKDTGYQNG